MLRPVLQDIFGNPLSNQLEEHEGVAPPPVDYSVQQWTFTAGYHFDGKFGYHGYSNDEVGGGVPFPSFGTGMTAIAPAIVDPSDAREPQVRLDGHESILHGWDVYEVQGASFNLYINKPMVGSQAGIGDEGWDNLNIEIWNGSSWVQHANVVRTNGAFVDGVNGSYNYDYLHWQFGNPLGAGQLTVEDGETYRFTLNWNP